MRSKLKTLFAVVGALAVVTAISLIVISRGPLYGQVENDNWVPDLCGEWISEAVGYSINNVTNPLDPPEYSEGSLSDDGNIFITEQNGRVFTGTFEEDEGKLTGVILPDRTVSIQLFEQSELRFFLTGRLTKSGNTLQISGYIHLFDDFHGFRVSPRPDDSEWVMATGYAQLTKVN